MSYSLYRWFLGKCGIYAIYSSQKTIQNLQRPNETFRDLKRLSSNETKWETFRTLHINQRQTCEWAVLSHSHISHRWVSYLDPNLSSNEPSRTLLTYLRCDGALSSPSHMTNHAPVFQRARDSCIRRDHQRFHDVNVTQGTSRSHWRWYSCNMSIKTNWHCSLPNNTTSQ